MRFFIDANVVIYAAVPGEHRAPCVEVLEAIARGEADGVTSPAVLEEVWHIERSGRAGKIDGLAERAYAVLAPLVAVDDEAFRRALALEAAGLGTNDRLHAGTCLAHGIGTVLTADRGFDGIRGLRRTDPLDRRAVRRLIGG